MRRLCILFAVTVAVVLCLGVPAMAAKQEDITGIWQGKLKAGASELRIVFRISRDSSGSLTAKMDSPDQGAKDIPVTRVVFADRTIRLEIKAIQGVFEGELDENGSRIVGTWEQGPVSLPLTVERAASAYTIQRPQDPRKPYPYREEEVTYENAADGVRLAGTLTMPGEGGPFPAVLLISGSGAQDRNEEIMGHRPFFVIADYLTRRGVAVLRVDDRGVGGSTGDLSQATSRDLAMDVLAGVAYLRSREEIDSDAIGLIGHSEGGLIAPIAATESDDVAFMVLMAGPGLAGEELLYLQSEMINRAMGASEEIVQRRLGEQKRIFSIVREVEDLSVAREKLDAVYDDIIAGLSEAEKQAIGDVDAYKRAQIDQVLSPWMRFFLTYDPRPVLTQIKCPVLALNGEKDLQVPPDQNLKAMEEALKTGGNKDFTIRKLSGLNHLFQTCQTGIPAEYGAIEETISPEVLKIMGDWILQHTCTDPHGAISRASIDQ